MKKNKLWSFRHFIKEWKTSLIAVFVVIITAFFVITRRATFTEVWPAWTFAAIMLGLKDKDETK